MLHESYPQITKLPQELTQHFSSVNRKKLVQIHSSKDYKQQINSLE